MRFRLKYFLLLSLILGAVVTPFAHREYLKWKQRQEEEVRPQFVAVVYVPAASMAKILQEVYADYLKPAAGADKPRLALSVDEASNALTITAKPALLQKVMDLIKSIDQPSRPTGPIIRIKQIEGLRKDGPAFNDLSSTTRAVRAAKN